MDTRGSIRAQIMVEVAAAFGVLLMLTLCTGALAAPLEIFICGGVDANGVLQTCSAPSPTTATEIGSGKAGATVSGAGGSQVPLNPKIPLQTPAGWTNPTAPSLAPLPPGTTGNASVCVNNTAQTACLPNSTGGDEAAATAAIDAVNVNFWYVVSNWNSISGPTGMRACHFSSAQGSVVANCPGNNGVFTFRRDCVAGYTSTGGVCTLSNAALVQKPVDGSCGMTRVGNSYTADPNDPDCAAGVSPTLVQGGGGLVIGTGTGGSSVSVQVNSGGDSVVTDSRPDASGNTTNKKTYFGPPDPTTGTVTVTGYSQTTSPGAGTVPTPDPAPVADPCGAPGQPACKIDETGTPTDAGSLSAAGTALGDQQSSGVAAIEALGTSSKRTDLGITMGITWPNVTCTNPSFAIAGKVLTVDMCSHQAEVQSITGWLVAILGAFMAFGMIREIN